MIPVINLRLTGATVTHDRLKAAAREWPRLQRRIVLETVMYGEMRTKEEIKSADLLFRRQLLNSVSSRVIEEGASAATRIRGGEVYSDAPYASVMEDGRRPGSKQPPVDAILPWVVQKVGGGQFRRTLRVSGHPRAQAGARGASNAAYARSVAWVIARSIKRKGIKGRGYFLRAYWSTLEMAPKIQDAAMDDFVRAYGEGA